jgi:hypothetical protein
MNVPVEGCIRKASRALNLISMFLLKYLSISVHDVFVIHTFIRYVHNVDISLSVHDVFVIHTFIRYVHNVAYLMKVCITNTSCTLKYISTL